MDTAWALPPWWASSAARLMPWAMDSRPPGRSSPDSRRIRPAGSGKWGKAL